MKYIDYEVYECPKIPTEPGRYVGKTPILEQAQNCLNVAKLNGKSYFIKGVTADGKRIVFL